MELTEAIETAEGLQRSVIVLMVMVTVLAALLLGGVSLDLIKERKKGGKLKKELSTARAEIYMKNVKEVLRDISGGDHDIDK